jgi:hypothetical protein
VQIKGNAIKMPQPSRALTFSRKLALGIVATLLTTLTEWLTALSALSVLTSLLTKPRLTKALPGDEDEICKRQQQHKATKIWKTNAMNLYKSIL